MSHAGPKRECHRPLLRRQQRPSGGSVASRIDGETSCRFYKQALDQEGRPGPYLPFRHYFKQLTRQKEMQPAICSDASTRRGATRGGTVWMVAGTSTGLGSRVPGYSTQRCSHASLDNARPMLAETGPLLGTEFGTERGPAWTDHRRPKQRRISWNHCSGAKRKTRPPRGGHPLEPKRTHKRKHTARSHWNYADQSGKQRPDPATKGRFLTRCSSSRSPL